MGISSRKLLRLLVEHDPASPEFRNGVRETPETKVSDVPPVDNELALWHDVFVQQKLPWGRFLQSVLLHGTALVLIWALSLAWLRQQKILGPTSFDRSSLVTYTPNEYLPPLDTGRTEAKPQTGDPVFAKQPILSVPREADNRTQTVVVPPDVKLDHDVLLPNIIASGSVAPAVPLDATDSLSHRAVAPDQQVVAPAPEVEFARDRVNQAALKSSVVPPPPDLASKTIGNIGPMNITPSDVVAPAPQLTVAEQHTLSSRSKGGDGHLPSSNPVAPPPSMGGGTGPSQGRLVALGIHPVAPTGPVPVPSGNRRGAFSATPEGRTGASGTPEIKGSKSAPNGDGSTGHNGSLPEGLRVGAVPGSVSNVERNGDAREVASLPSNQNTGNRRAASAVSDDKITDVDRQVFGERRPYAMTLNMPNLNSFTGSWVMRFAELQPDPKQGVLLAPVPTEKSDPGYPLELMRANVHGMVTLYAVIRSDGHIGEIRVLNGPDERLDAYAADALARWKFLPAIRAGKPVPIEAVVLIPFRVHRDF
jgi:TonB family protein